MKVHVKRFITSVNLYYLSQEDDDENCMTKANKEAMENEAHVQVDKE